MTSDHEHLLSFVDHCRQHFDRPENLVSTGDCPLLVTKKLVEIQQRVQSSGLQTPAVYWYTCCKNAYSLEAHNAQ